MQIIINTDSASFHSESDLVLDSYIMAEQLNVIFKNIVSKVRDGGKDGKVVISISKMVGGNIRFQRRELL